jgi:hypothetical protein
VLFDKNDATNPTRTDIPGVGISVLYIYFTDKFDSASQTFYSFFTSPTDDIIVDLVGAYANPIKMSFSLVNS